MTFMRPLLALALVLPLLSAHAAPPLGAFAPFVGTWRGALEYQDYAGSGRVRVPVVLEVRAQSASSAAWNFVYDDFGRTVKSLETHILQGDTYQVVTQGQTEVQRYQVAGFTKRFSGGVGVAVLLGSELENGQPVEVRRTVTLGRGTLTTLKETRKPGGTFAFRNQSTYTRSAR